MKKIVLKGSTDDDFCSIGVDGTDAGEGNVVGWVEKGGKGEVCSGKEEKGVYDNIGSIEETRTGWEGKDEDGERSCMSRRRSLFAIEGKEMEDIESRED